MRYKRTPGKFCVESMLKSQTTPPPFTAKRFLMERGLYGFDRFPRIKTNGMLKILKIRVNLFHPPTPRSIPRTFEKLPSLMKPTVNNETNYRWYILALAALTHTLCVAMPVMCLPVLFKEISEELGLSLVQIGLVWGIAALPGMVAGLAGGGIGDRFGPRRTLSVVCVLAGAAGALRGTAGSFATFGATIVLFGFLSPIIPMNVHKTCGVWFSKRQLGLANGVVSMGMALGFMASSLLSATILSPWLGGWRNVLFFYGVISVGVGLLWRTTRPAPQDTGGQARDAAARSFWQNLVHVGKIRNVWLLGIALLGIGGCIQGTLGYLPLYLRGLGWTETLADSAAGSFHFASMLFVIPLALLSDRLGSRKKLLQAAALIIAMGVGLLSIAGGALVWAAILLAGMVRDGFMAIYMTMVIETEGVGGVYAGTATGLAFSFSGLGSLLAPPLGNSMAEAIAPGFPFLFWATLAAGGWLALYFTREKARV